MLYNVALAKKLSLPIYRYPILFAQGKRIKGNFFNLIYQENKKGRIRLAILVNKNIDKKATRRNKIKRKTSHGLKENLKKNKLLSIDLIVLPKKQVFLEKQNSLDLEMIRLLSKINNTNNDQKISS